MVVDRKCPWLFRNAFISLIFKIKNYKLQNFSPYGSNSVEWERWLITSKTFYNTVPYTLEYHKQRKIELEEMNLIWPEKL